MTRELLQGIADQALKDLNLDRLMTIAAIKRPPYEADPTWWIDLTEKGNPHTFQLFIPLDAHDTSDAVREKIKKQLHGRSLLNRHWA